MRLNNNHRVSLAVLAGLVTLIALSPKDAISQLGYIAGIRLQPTTPGTADTGHGNISGTMTAAEFVGGGAGVTGVNAALLGGLSPSAFLQSVPNPLTLSGNSPTHIISATNTSLTQGSAAIKGLATGNNATTYAVFGQTDSGNGRGIYGLCTHPTNFAYAGYFENQGTQGHAVYAIAKSTAIRAQSTLDGDGVFALTSSPDTTGVYGLANATTGSQTIGVCGQSRSSTGIGVYGVTLDNNSLSNYGGYFTSARGTGVYGLTTLDPGIGGSFEARGFSGVGAYAIATHTSGGNYGVLAVSNSSSGVGVKGVALANGTNIGVWGVTGAANGWGVYSDGRLGASGTKLFRIDHPADPENKYLQHYCNESPAPQNTYQGTIITDENGWATVDLPSYYDSINKDAKVQLTVDDESEDFVLCKVVGGVRGGQFKIRTNKPGVKVYWLVSADRNDLWVQKYGTPVEVEKEEVAKGTYQHPELYDLPSSKGIHYKLDQMRARPATNRPKRSSVW